MEFVVTTLFLGQPIWMWLVFLALVGALLVFDLGVLHKGDRRIGVRESLALSAFYITLGVAFSLFVWSQLGARPALEYLTGFVVEKTLAMDNVFVIASIFGYFATPREYQHRVLFWGILGVIVLRALMIGFGAALVANFEWVLYVFAAFLIFTGFRLAFHRGGEADLPAHPLFRLLRRRMRITDELDGHKFIVRREDPATGRVLTYATPLLVVLILIEVADVIFAVDSVPAIFAITTDPYVVYTSNIFAILGLRALYFALAAVMFRFAYLKQALAVLLVFIGSKIFIADLFGWTKFPIQWSLGISFAILAAGVAYSLWRTRHNARPAAAPR
jgi:tellurite resistance protein TerC